MKKLFSILMMVGCLCWVAGCSSEANEPEGGGTNNEQPSEEPVYPTLSDEEISLKANEFYFNLIKTVGEQKKGENFVISPYSMYAASSLLANGAAGKTRADLIKALGFDGANIEDFNRYNKSVIEAMKAEKKVGISLANSIWYAARLKLVNDFSETLNEYYGAETIKINRETVKSDLNDWCNEHTKGQIPYITMPNYGADIMLANALYFRGLWTEEFIPDDTKPDLFHNLDGTTSKVDFMNSKVAPFTFDETDYAVMGYQTLTSKFCFAVVIPKDDNTPADCLKRLCEGDWEKVVKSPYVGDIIVKLPKFRVEKEFDLMDALKEMGMASTLTAGDYSNITKSGPLSFSMVYQKASLEIDEKGVVGAAVTVGSGVMAWYERSPKMLIADRPFLFFVYHYPTQAILFAGQITKL